MLRNSELNTVKALIESQHSFVLNIVASWCPDCTQEQAPNLPLFAEQLQDVGLDLINLLVQEEKRVYLSQAHEHFVDQLGGHGFPRTVLFINGQAVDTDNVEILKTEALTSLGKKFIVQIN
jgi:thiol-disulfide isomerase/thioredoxin